MFARVLSLCVCVFVSKTEKAKRMANRGDEQRRENSDMISSQTTHAIISGCMTTPCAIGDESRTGIA